MSLVYFEFTKMQVIITVFNARYLMVSCILIECVKDTDPFFYSKIRIK